MAQELVLLKDDSGAVSLCIIFVKESLDPGAESGPPAKVCVFVRAHACLLCFSSGLQESLLLKQKVLLLPKSEELNILNLEPMPS